jgi:hypothetical protein
MISRLVEWATDPVITGGWCLARCALVVIGVQIIVGFVIAAVVVFT